MKTCTFNGRRYLITIDSLDGMCDTYNKEREIVILADLNTRAGLETVLNEAGHASDWKASEEKISRMAKDTARLLWGLNYRIK